MIYLKLHVFPSARSFLRANKALSLHVTRESGLENPRQSISTSTTGVEHATMNVTIGGTLDVYRNLVSISPIPSPRVAWVVISTISPPQPDASEEDIGVDTIFYSDAEFGSLDIQDTVLFMACAPNFDTYYLTTPHSQLHLHRWLSQSIIQNSIVRAIKQSNVPPVLSAFGPKTLVDSFLASWSAASMSPLKIREQAFLVTKLAYLTAPLFTNASERASELQYGEIRVEDVVPLSSRMDPKHMNHIIDQLVDCILEFWNMPRGDSKSKAQQMVAEVLKSQEKGRIWLCIRDEGGDSPNFEVAGYVYTGRETATTIAIRNVFVKSSWRGKKLASQLVSAACQFWLLESGTPTNKRKDAVTLFVEPSNQPATRAYQRCGFVIQEETWVRNGFDGVHPGNF